MTIFAPAYHFGKQIFIFPGTGSRVRYKISGELRERRAKVYHTKTGGAFFETKKGRVRLCDCYYSALMLRTRLDLAEEATP